MDLFLVFCVAGLGCVLGFICGKIETRHHIETAGNLIIKGDEDGVYMFLEASEGPSEFMAHDFVTFRVIHSQD